MKNLDLLAARAAQTIITATRSEEIGRKVQDERLPGVTSGSCSKTRENHAFPETAHRKCERGRAANEQLAGGRARQ